MQYVVEVTGKVSNKHKKAYVVDSNTEQEAQVIAKNNFCNEFSTNGDTTSILSNKRTIKAILSFIFLIIPILLSFINWKVEHNTISISPDYISCLYGVIIYSSFIIRFKGIQRTVSSWIDILFCVFIVLLLASFVRTILVSNTINILGIFQFNIDANVILPIAIILSWLGLKAVSLTCMAGVVLTALFNITSLNLAMGHIFGPIYIICSFIGIILYLSVEPAVVESISSLKKFTNKSLDNINDDVNIAKNKIKKVENKNNNK